MAHGPVDATAAFGPVDATAAFGRRQLIRILCHVPTNLLGMPAYTRERAYGQAEPLPPGGGSAAQKERERTKSAVRYALDHLNERDGVLDLSYNTLIHDDEKGFAPGGNVFNLNQLNLTSCGLAPPGVEAIVAALHRGFAGTNLKSLIFSHNSRMGDTAVTILAQGLVGCPFCPQLEELSLSNTSCGDAGMEALTNCLATLPGLKRLAVDCNAAIGEQGWTALGRSLQTCTICGVKTQGLSTACACGGDLEFRSPVASLTHLFVQGCTGLGCKGVEQLHLGLTKAPVLEDLVTTLPSPSRTSHTPRAHLSARRPV